MEVWKALQKVREAVVAAEEAFTAVLLKVTNDNKVTTVKASAETVSKTLAKAIGAVDSKLRAADPTPAAQVAAGPAATLGRLVEDLKPGVLTLDASPIEVRQWKRKLVTYLCRSGFPN